MSRSILEGVTAEGDTALHVVAACGQGDDLLTRRADRHALTTFGYFGGDKSFLDTAKIIYMEGEAPPLCAEQQWRHPSALRCMGGELRHGQTPHSPRFPW
jgi:hypothetical protein